VALRTDDVQRINAVGRNQRPAPEAYCGGPCSLCSVAGIVIGEFGSEGVKLDGLLVPIKSDNKLSARL
jgi:hypothetical protein